VRVRVVTREDFIALTVRVNAVVYLQLARECLLLNNFNSTMEILSGLNNSSIVRLKKLWEVRPSGLLSLSLSSLFRSRLRELTFNPQTHSTSSGSAGTI
jgi:hypothetical protein